MLIDQDRVPVVTRPCSSNRSLDFFERLYVPGGGGGSELSQSFFPGKSAIGILFIHSHGTSSSRQTSAAS
jgi:hypothetical protein